tara:strand:+ start:1064 stop:2083 length:1020 start_codon:yes stop_codon:yes gene_type:complete
MSEEIKTGEDLIEKVEQESAETTEETKEAGFDPTAFMSEGKTTETEEVKEEVKEEESNTKEEESDDFTWDSVETEAKEKVEQEEEEDDWDAEPEAKTEDAKEEQTKETGESPYDWETLAGEIGVKAKDEDTFKAEVKKMLDNPPPVNDTITQLQDFLKMGDRKLVEADLEASGLEKSEIKDTVDRMQDSGLLKREAVVLRKNLQNYIVNERDRLRKIEKDRVAQEEKANLENRKALQSYIKEKEDFFGGKIKNTEKKELYNYITSGNFSKELYSNHANVADAAFLWKYKDKIFKMLRGQGMEKGKAAVINKITNPSLGRKSQHVETKQKGGFDPAEFMK